MKNAAYTQHQATALDSFTPPGAKSDPIDWLLSGIPAPDAPDPGARVVLVLALAVAAMVLLLLAWFYLKNIGWGKSPGKAKKNGLFQPKSILTPNEIEFYNRMVSALPGYVVLSQVAMSAFIEPRTDDPKEYMRRRMKFAQKFVDFIVCEPGDLRIICIVELDDITHDEAKDALRDEMLGSAGYTVVRWHSRKKPDRATIAKTIRKLDANK